MVIHFDSDRPQTFGNPLITHNAWPHRVVTQSTSAGPLGTCTHYAVFGNVHTYYVSSGLLAPAEGAC